MVTAAVPASAALVTNLKYVGAVSSFDSTVYKSVEVVCPGGKILGGSYELRGAEGAVVLDDFIPFDEGNRSGLRVGAGEIVGPGEPSDGTKEPWQLFALATCGNPPPGYSIIARTTGAAHREQQSVIAPCPLERRLLGGGASLSNGFGQVSISGLTFLSSKAEATAWTDKDGYSDAWSLNAYAICADPATGWQTTTLLSPITSNVALAQAAECVRPKQVIGAGWHIHRHEEFIDSPDRYVTRAEMATVETSIDPGVTVHAMSTTDTRGRWYLQATAVCVD